MGAHQISFQLSDMWNVFLSQDRDAYLMDLFCCSGGFSPMDLKHLNAVRLYLQVATVADVATADGKCIQKEYYEACPCISRHSRWTWQRQPIITKHQQELWQHACRITILQTTHEGKKHTTNCRLQTPLGQWIAEQNQTWSNYYDPASDCLFTNVEGSAGHIHYSSTAIQTKRFKKGFSVEWEYVADAGMSSLRVPADVEQVEPGIVYASYVLSHNKPHLPRSNPLSFSEYIKTLPPYRRRLLSWSKPPNHLSIKQSLHKC
jgi:hypothetical protein